MDDVDRFSVQQVASIADSTTTILESTEPIPPEVRHYLTLLRHLCGDVQKLHGLREKRIEYLSAAPHDLSEVNGILAVSMLGAAKFDAILSKYQPTYPSETTEVVGEATMRSEETAWLPKDIQELCKMAENVPFQREAISATIGRLAEGSYAKDDGKVAVKAGVQTAGSKRISNVHLLNSLFGSKTNHMMHDLQRSDSMASSIGIIETASQVLVSKQEKPALVSVQSNPRNSQSSFASSGRSSVQLETSPEGPSEVDAEKSRTPKPLENEQRRVPVKPDSNGVNIMTKKPDRRVGLQALFSGPLPLGRNSSLYSPPTTFKPAAATTTRSSSEISTAQRLNPAASYTPNTVQEHIRPTPQLVNQPSTCSTNAILDSASRSSQDEGSLRSLTQEEKQVVNTFPSVPPPLPTRPIQFPPPTPIQPRHTISEMTTLPEVVVEEPVWWAQRQRLQQQSRDHLPVRSPSTQARYSTAKAAELQKMFAPVAELKPAGPDISHVRAAAAAGFGRPPQSSSGPGQHKPLSKQPHYSSSSAMAQYSNRARSQTQPTPPTKIMFYELDSCTTLDSVSSVTPRTAPIVESTDDDEKIRKRVDSISSQESTSMASISIYSPPPIYESDENELNAHIPPTSVKGEHPSRQSSVDENILTHVLSEDSSAEGESNDINERKKDDLSQDPSITPTPSVFRRSRNRTDSGAWVRRTQMFRAED